MSSCNNNNFSSVGCPVVEQTINSISIKTPQVKEYWPQRGYGDLRCMLICSPSSDWFHVRTNGRTINTTEQSLTGGSTLWWHFSNHPQGWFPNCGRYRYPICATLMTLSTLNHSLHLWDYSREQNYSSTCDNTCNFSLVW